MRIQIVGEHNQNRRNVGWLSFQPDGSISFGLNDRCFIVRRFNARIGIFNAYNRYRAEFMAPTIDTSALASVVNPHFTYHPIAMFHLKANGDETLFEGLCDLSIVLEQQQELPWIRAISNPLHSLPSVGTRADGVKLDYVTLGVDTDRTSIAIAIDLLKPSSELKNVEASKLVHHTEWHGVVARLSIGVVNEQPATLSWYHEY